MTIRLTLFLIFAASILCEQLHAQVDYRRISPGGLFQVPALWTPFDPVNFPPQLGPGGANDNAIFDLGFGFFDTYTINNVNGINNQLVVESDSVILEIAEYELTSIAFGQTAGILVGRDPGDLGRVTFSGGIGANLDSNYATVGFGDGSTGIVNVQGTTFVWDNQFDISVGFFGSGDLNISQSATVFSENCNIAAGSTSSGAVRVSGFTSRLSNHGILAVGSGSTGTLDVTTGATVSTGIATIGQLNNGDGLVTLNNSLTNMSVDDLLIVGELGMGTMEIVGGADATAGTMRVGDQTEGDGSVVLDGEGSSLTVAGGGGPFGGLMTIGNSGTGSLEISNGAEALIEALSIGDALSGVGVVTLDGEGSNLSTDIGNFLTDLFVGVNGNGSLTIRNGATANIQGTSFVGSSGGSTGQVLVEGDGSMFSTPATLSIGGSGMGVFTVRDQGMTEAGTISMTGSAVLNVEGQDSLLSATEEIIVGEFGPGTMAISSGGGVTSPSLIVGRFFGSDGIVTVDGPESLLDFRVFGNTSMFGQLPGSIGNLTIQNGGQVCANVTRFGNDPDSMGELIVDGPGSTFMSATSAGGAAIFVGDQGNGFVNVSNGSNLSVLSIFAGSGASGCGDVLVDSGAMVYCNFDVLIGILGEGIFSVQSGSIVDCRNAAIARRPGSIGVVGVDDPSTQWNIECDLSIGGDYAEFSAGGTGSLSIGGFGGPNDPYVDVGKRIIVFPSGSLTLRRRGRLSAGSILLEGGEFDFQGGALDVGLFDGELNNSNATLSPGFSATRATTINGDYSQELKGSMELGIGGPLVGTDYDFVNVTGTALLGGEFSISLINGFIPQAGQSFTVLNADSVIGFFENVTDNQRLNTDGGSGSFLVRYGPLSPNSNQIVLSDFQPSFALGDVNGDGDVNLLDVAPFVDLLTSGGFLPAADINQDGDVNLLDVGPFVNLLAG